MIVSRFVIRLIRSGALRYLGACNRNTGILPVLVGQASCLAMSRRLGSLHDLSGWKPELLFVAERFDGVERGGFACWIKAEEDADGCAE